MPIVESEAIMDCLWLTLADPDPATNGQLIYSKGLIEAVAEAGASLHVIGLARPENQRAPLARSDLAWQLHERQSVPSWRRVLSGLPEIALHASPPAAHAAVERALQRDWDAVIFDSICSGWALGAVLRHRRCSSQPPRLVHVAHNHEVVVARRIADEARGARRLAKELDALKVGRLEGRLIREADLLTSNTPEDCRAFAAEAAGRPVVFLPPGYGGPRLNSRTIDATVPRRAVVVGSFDWPPKRISLERFLDVAASRLAGAGIDLQIVGAAEADYLGGLRRRFPSVTFTGPVEDVRPYMASARVALVPDLLGGFKLKGLDYVFNRLPILAMRIALPAMPLDDGVSIGLFDSHKALADGVVALIDDLALLNGRQERAFAACAEGFDWGRLGRQLLMGIRAVEPRRNSASDVTSMTRAAAG
jgi:glycosyltransferase involved in cell wall biosynthesis